jgi:hypothetical protein
MTASGVCAAAELLAKVKNSAAKKTKTQALLTESFS